MVETIYPPIIKKMEKKKKPDRNTEGKEKYNGI